MPANARARQEESRKNVDACLARGHASMTHSQPRSQPDLLEQIPDPATVQGWLADSIRRSDLLRSLLRLARRKAAYVGYSEIAAKESTANAG
jgi:hypothetical protein